MTITWCTNNGHLPGKLKWTQDFWPQKFDHAFLDKFFKFQTIRNYQP